MLKEIITSYKEIFVRKKDEIKIRLETDKPVKKDLEKLNESKGVSKKIEVFEHLKENLGIQ